MDLRQAITDTDDRPIVPVDVPQWPATAGQLGLRLLGGDLMDLAEFWRTQVDGRPQRAFIVAMSLCERSTGNMLFADEAGLAALGQKSGLALDYLHTLIQTYNGIGLDEPFMAGMEAPNEEGPKSTSGRSIELFPCAPNDPRYIQWTIDCMKADHKAKLDARQTKGNAVTPTDGPPAAPTQPEAV